MLALDFFDSWRCKTQLCFRLPTAHCIGHFALRRVQAGSRHQPVVQPSCAWGSYVKHSSKQSGRILGLGKPGENKQQGNQSLFDTSSWMLEMILLKPSWPYDIPSPFPPHYIFFRILLSSVSPGWVKVEGLQAKKILGVGWSILNPQRNPWPRKILNLILSWKSPIPKS